jgi:glycosyltransferase involved in cell wall biosynthesis
MKKNKKDEDDFVHSEEVIEMPYTCPEFSILIPIYNEEENIPELYRRLTEVMEKLCGHINEPENCYEIIMVDDGSQDRSWQLISELHE